MGNMTKNKFVEWYIISGLVVFSMMFLVLCLIYPYMFFLLLSVIFILIFSIKIGLWRTMVLIFLVATTLKSNIFSDSISDKYWYLIQFTPLLVIIAKLIFESQSKLRNIDKLIIATIMLFNFIAMFTALTGVNQWNSFLQAILLIMVSLFLILTYMKRWVKQKEILADLYLVYMYLLTVGFIGLLFYVFKPDIVIADYGRYTGMFSNANYAGIMSVIGLMLGVYLYFVQKRRWRYLLIPGAVVLVFNLILSGSRGALLALFIGGATLFIIKEFRKKIYKYSLFIVPIIFVGVIWLLSSEIQNYIGAFSRVEQNSDITSGRMYIYITLIKHWLEYPVLGVGYRNVELLKDMDGLSAHNIYLSVLTEMGILGFLIFVLLVIFIVFAGANKILFATVFTILVIELTESTIFGFGGPTALISWMLMLIYAASQNKEVSHVKYKIE